MTKQKSTKRTLLASVLSLVLCITMLIGTTFAWFTDTATSNNNKIVAGNLDVQLLMYDENANATAENGKYVDISANSAPIFGAANSQIAQNDSKDTLWEPGKTQVVYLAIKNNGNLALKYQVVLDVTNPENGKNLYEAMQYVITPNAKDGVVTPWDATNAKVPELGKQVVSNGEKELKKGETHYFALSVHMKEEAGNEYQDGAIDFDLNVLATQLNAESDSFGTDYDKDATYYNPWDGSVDTELDEVNGVYQITSAAELVGFAQRVNSGDQDMMNANVVLTTSINLDNKEFTPIGNCNSGKYFRGTFDGDGNTIYNLTINNADEGQYATTGLFGWTDAAASTISNLIVDGATIAGHHWVGVIAGYHTGVIENCKVVNATINGTHANDDADGDKIGGIVGCLNSNSKLVNNTVENSTIYGNRDIGGVAGSVAKDATMTGNVVKDTVITYVTEKTNYASADVIVSGRTGFVPDSTNKSENVTVLQVVNSVTGLKNAIADAQAGETVTLGEDVDCGATQMIIDKNITIDLNGKTLTNSNGHIGFVMNSGSIKNGAIDYKGNVGALSVRGSLGSIEDVTINVAPKEGKTITGIQLVNGSGNRCIESLKDVTIIGATQGIEVKDCSPSASTKPAIGYMENVTIDATNVGMIVNGYIGQVKNCNIKGGNLGINMLLKGEYKVTLELTNCVVTGETVGIWAHDEIGKLNTKNCSLTLTYDKDTVINGGLNWDFEDECQSVVTLNKPQ